MHGFELITVVLLIPLGLAAWTMAWRAWLRPRGVAWIPLVVSALTIIYVTSQFLNRSWFYGVFPHSVVATSHFISTWVRVLFLALMLTIVLRETPQREVDRWFALPALILISIGLFAQELNELHIPGIWFPFGTGVSRTQFAYAAFAPVLFALLLHRVFSFARHRPFIARATLR